MQQILRTSIATYSRLNLTKNTKSRKSLTTVFWHYIVVSFPPIITLFDRSKYNTQGYQHPFVFLGQGPSEVINVLSVLL